MMKKKKAKKQTGISIESYIKAIKKADREIQISNQKGWTSTTRVHKSKKLYNRKRDKKNYSEE